MTALITFIAINTLLWLVIAAEATRRSRHAEDEPFEPEAHTTRGPRR